METLKKELIRKKIILTYEEWYELNALAFIVSNKHTPEELYAEYVNEVLNHYIKK